MLRFLFAISLFISTLSACSQSYKLNLTTQQTEALGLLIWKNEGQQKSQHLTTWNRGENFPSLGLGHFIWYPNKGKGPFKEQFPELLNYFKNNGVQPPPWLFATPLAPWKSREQFYSEFNGEKLTGLRSFLSEHLDLQVKFIVLRLEAAIPRIIADCNTQQKKRIKANLAQLTSTTAGLFTLLDYINFKGDGVSKKERYQGEGWGLKQVLLTMPKEYENPLRAFGLSADEVLTRRVKNSPRDEFRWLKGWRARIHAYQAIIAY
ncbi:MAG: hypothetical protein ACJAT7_001088 [Psychromonas sp.]|jgi:hypothetical protein|uniref:hypothetical protein n=1 Tax=Psychromonas sp. TaxID=1884585 RepID=UPI0039E6177F